MLRQRLLAIDRKILDLIILRKFTCPEEPDTFLIDWGRHLARTYRGRGRAFEEFLIQEQASLGGPGAMEARHPVVARWTGRLRAMKVMAATLRARTVRELP